MLSASRLIHWARLHDRRIPANMRWVVVVAVAAGAALAYELHRRASVSEQSRLWLIALLATTILAFVTAPFRIYWSRDADTLARYPIRGRPLFRLGLFRNCIVAGTFAIPSTIALGGFLGSGHIEVAIRHGVLAVAALAASALLAPACALLAGALAASERADAITKSFGGEFQAPRGAYLGLVPGVVSTAVVLVLITSTSWIASVDVSPAPVPLLALIGASAIAAWLADARADAVIPGAVRELSALNRRRLAHVEATSLSVIERLACAVLGRRTRVMVRKDLCLLRRRHPAYNLAQAGATIAAWALALRWPNQLEWIAALLVLMHVYSLVMAWRATQPPIERPRLAKTLPISTYQIGSAKRAPLHLRTLTISATIGSAMLYAADFVAAATLVLGTAVVTTLVGSLVIARSRVA